MGTTPAVTRQKSQAFTLIELLVVITIIGVMVALLMPAISKARDEAKLVVCLSQQHGLFFSLTTFCNDNRDHPPIGYGDGLTGLTGDPSSSTDPYRWVYTGFGQLWAQGYIENRKLMIDPGFVNHIDENAMGWQAVNVVQPNGDLSMFDGLQPFGWKTNGIVGWRFPTSPGYRGGTYTLNLADPDTYNWPYAQSEFFPLRKYPFNAMMLCAQSTFNKQQNSSQPWYLMRKSDCHNRENMNCTYGDGAGKRMNGVREYVAQVYDIGDWTWQVSSTDNAQGQFYWWPWANAQR